MTVSTSTHKVKPDNNLAALAYGEQDYGRIRACGVIGMIAYIGGLFIAGMLFFFRKMVGLEYICMLQLVYLSSLITEYSNPMMGPLQRWHYISGYNNMTVSIADVEMVANKWSTLGYKNYFFANFNVMLFLSLTIYGVALILLLLSLISERTTERKLKDASKFFAMEIGFSFMVFSLNNILIAIIMEYQSGTLLYFGSSTNKLIMLVTLAIAIMHIILFLVKAPEYTDSMVFYHRQKTHSHYFPFVFILRNLLLLISILLEQMLGEISTHFCLAIEAIYLVSVVVAKPYRKNIDYVRFAVVEATLTVSLVCKFIESNFVFSPYSTKLKGALDFLVYLVLVGFVLSWVMTVASFVYHFWKGRTKEVEVIPGGEEDYEPPVIVKKQKKKENFN